MKKYRHQNCIEDDENELKDLQKVVNFAQNEGSMKILSSLKFQNTIYTPGTNISLKSDKDYYGRIICIAKIPQVKFPILLISWYYDNHDLDQQYLNIKQLFWTQQIDWQYIESVTGKISILTLPQYQSLEIQKRTKDTFFIRSKLNPITGLITPPPQKICQCQSIYNPDYRYSICSICQKQFHPECSKDKNFCSNCK